MGVFTVDFTKPVKNLTFTSTGDNNPGVVGFADVFVNGAFVQTVNITYDGILRSDDLVDLSAFSNITKVVLRSIDVAGLGWSNFKFSTADEFKISFSAFIPHDNVPGPPLDTCRTTPPHPLRRDLYYRGDTRSFGATATSYRVRQKLTVIPDAGATESVDAAGLKTGSIQNLIGQSRSYADDALLNNGTLDDGDNDDIEDDCVLFHKAATAQVTQGHPMTVTVNRINEHKVEVHLTGGPPNPLSELARLVATLDWDFTITIDTSGDKPHWTLEGAHDGFPAYEIYINDVAIDTYSPGTPPFTLQHTRALMPPLDISLSKQGDLP